jgi:cellulose synthase operon protein C
MQYHEMSHGPQPVCAAAPAIGDHIMSRSAFIRLFLTCSVLAALLTGCSRDPNVRKQKYLESGDRYFAKAKYREAAIQYSNAIQLDSRFAQAHYQLGQTYLKLGDQSHAFQELSRTVELAPDNYSAHVDLANLLVTQRNRDGSVVDEALKQALPHLELAREKQPNAPETYEAWANYYAAQNKVPAALQEMQHAIAADPNRSESYLLTALLQLRGNLFDQAEGNLKKAAATGPAAMNAQLALGSFYQSRNRMAEAEQQFQHAVQVDPKDPTPRAALVRLYMAEGKKSDAEAFLRQTKTDLSDSSEGYRMLGDFYFANGDLDKALDEYASIYNDHPRDLQVKRNYIQILILKNRIDEAAKLNDDILKTNPRDGDALIYRGQIQLRKNDPAGAADSFQNALRNDQDNAVAHYQLGLAFDQQHNEGRAEEEWRAAVRLRPDLTDAQRALATLELHRGNLESLNNYAEQIITFQPNSPDGYMLRAVAEMNRQKYSQADADLRKAASIAPQSPAPLIQMGNLHLLQKQHSEAESYYQQALDKDSGSGEALSGLMNAYFADKQPDRAIAAARVQITKSPDNSLFYDLLGTALFNSKKDLPAAETALRKAIDLDKNNSDAMVKLGKVQIDEGSADKALALYQESIKENPREVTFYILAGELYESKNDWDHAKTMYQQALNLQSDNPTASNNLAYVMLQQGGNVDIALAMAQTARRGRPDWPNAADTLGWAYYQKGVYQSAIDLFQESLRLSERQGAPEDATLHYHLGLAYEKANQPVQARQQLERALKISPNNSDAKKALQQLRS